MEVTAKYVRRRLLRLSWAESAWHDSRGHLAQVVARARALGDVCWHVAASGQLKGSAEAALLLCIVSRVVKFM